MAKATHREQRKNIYDAIVIGARCAGSPTAMLLARRGYNVLLVDRARFPSDTISTHIIWPYGIAKLQKWGVLDKIIDSNCPKVNRFTIDLGDFPLSGWGPPVDGISSSYSPRRIILDKILVDAAAESGADVLQGFSVQEILTDDKRVTGIRGKDSTGSVTEFNADIIIGADGKNSRLASVTSASTYDYEPSRSCFYYTYWSGVEVDGYEDYWDDRSFALAVPTNDNLVMIVVGRPIDEFSQVRTNIEGSYMKTIDNIPQLRDRVRAGSREYRFYGTADVPNFFRTPFGNGWALVGDASHNKDPITAFGISDAFRDAELLVEAVDAGFSGNIPLEDALSEYELRRNEASRPLYDLTLRAARYKPRSPRALELREALRGNQPDIDSYIGVITGSISQQSFFDTANISRILAKGTS